MKRQKRKTERNPKAFFKYVLERVQIRIVAGKSGLNDQYRCPTGHPGRLAAKLMNQGHEPLTLWGLTTVKIASDAVILDVGCGGGKTVNRLAQQAPQGKVFGIDYSADMVEYSKKVNRKLIAQNHVQIVEGSVEKMSFPNDYFDLVTAFESYYFWPFSRCLGGNKTGAEAKWKTNFGE